MARVPGVEPDAHSGCSMAAVAPSYCDRASGLDLAEPDGAFYFYALVSVIPIGRKILMTPSTDTKSRRVLGGLVSAAIVSGAVALGVIVLYHVNSWPRTDDAEILANFIG